MPALLIMMSSRPWRATALVDLGVEGRRVGDVEHDRVAADLGRRGRGGVGCEVVDDDQGAVGGEAPGERRAEPGSGTGDEGDLTVEDRGRTRGGCGSVTAGIVGAGPTSSTVPATAPLYAGRTWTPPRPAT